MKKTKIFLALFVLFFLVISSSFVMDNKAQAATGWTYSGSGTFNGYKIQYTYTMVINPFNYYDYDRISATAVITEYTGSSPNLDIDHITVPYIKPPSLSTEEENIYRNRNAQGGKPFPTSIDCKVTEIGPGAFADCKTLNSVSLPVYVKLGDMAFYHCSNLESVDAYTLVRAEGSDIFGGCSSLKSVSVKALPNYVDGYLWNSKLFAGVPSIESVYLDNGITEIGTEAFQDCTGIKMMTLPSTVTKVGAYAFSGCTSLKSISLPSGIQSINPSTFYNCSSLLSVTIPNNVTYIGSNAFRNCKVLSSIVLPSNVGRVDSNAFYGCTALKKVTIPTGAVMLGSNIFFNCNSLQEVNISAGGQTGTWTGSSLFQNNTSILKLTLYDGVVGIYPNSFSGCINLSEIEVPDSVAVIGEDAFRDTRWLEDQPQNTLVYAGKIAYQYKGNPGLVNSGVVSVKNGTIGISTNAFYGKTGLRTVYLPVGLDSINSFAFSGCTNLTTVNIPTGIKTFGTGIFENCSSLSTINITLNPVKTYFDSSVFSGNPFIQTLAFANGITSVGASTFANCPKLYSITLPSSITSISPSAFKGCTSLSSIKLPDYLSSIGESAFSGCTSLVSFILPASVTTIGNNALSNCSKLSSLTATTSITSLGSNVLSGCNSLRNVTIVKGSSSSWNCSLFTYNTNITNITFNDTITSIGRKMFSGCSGLTNVKLPNSLTTLGMATFYGCTSLKSIHLPNTLVNYGPEDVYNFQVGKTKDINANITAIGPITKMDWVSSDSKIISINDYSMSSLRITGRAPGSCVLTCYYTYQTYNTKLLKWEDNPGSVSFKFTIYPKIFDNSGVTTIYGSAGSAAESYAKSNGFQFIAVDSSGRINLSTSRVTEVSAQTYNGNAIVPPVQLFFQNAYLVKDRDYSISYKNNINVGTATITITGKGNYSGTIKRTFKINPRSIANISVTPISYTYDGKAKGLTIKYGTTILKNGTDYSITYTNNTKVGTATATITGKGNYSGMVKKSFKINTKSIESLTVTLSATSYTFDKKAKTPTVTIKYGTIILKNGTDYSTTYTNNIKAGTATVTIKGKGNYSGTVKKTYKINTRSLAALSITLSTSSYSYDGKAKKPSITIKFGSTVLKNGVDYSVTYSNNIKIGTASVTITGKGNYSGTAKRTFRINSKAPTISVSSGTKYALVKWNKISGANGYTLHMSSSKNGSYSLIKTLTSSNTNYKVIKLTKGKTYYFKMMAYTNIGGTKYYSSYSSIKSIKIK